MANQEAKIVVTVEGGQLAADIAAKLKDAMKGLNAEVVLGGKEAKEASTLFAGWGSVLDSVFGSFPAKVAEGVLLRDAIHQVLDVVKEMATALPEIALKGAAVADVEENFKRLTTQAGLLGDTLLGTLRSGTHNTITDFELMKTVNKDLAAGLHLTDQQFGTLAKGAFALAQATGVDVKQALDTMNDAMLTGRTRALALLTSKIDTAKAEEAYAKTLGVTADKLSDADKLEAARVAILDSVTAATARLGDQTDGLDERVDQLKTHWENFKEDLGKTIATSDALTTALDGVQDMLRDAFGGNQKALIEAIAQAIDNAIVSSVGLTGALVQGAGYVVVEWYAVKKVFGDIMQVLDGVRLSMAYVQKGLIEIDRLDPTSSTSATENTRRWQENDDAIQHLLVTMRARGDALQEDSRKQADVNRGVDQYVARLKDLQDKVRAAAVGSREHADATHAMEAALGDANNVLGRHGDLIKDVTEKTKKHKYEVVGLGDAGEKFVEEYEGRVNKALAAYYERLEQIIPAQKEWWTLLGNAPQIGDIIESAVPIVNLDKMLPKSELDSLVGLMVGAGLEAGSGFSKAFGDSLTQLPDILMRAFEGGGGFEGAIKSFAVLTGHNFAKSLIETIEADLKAHPLASGLSTGALKSAAGVGATAGIAAAAGGGSTAHQLAEVGMAAAGVAVEVATMTTATIASSVALGAMTFGVGAAAVGLVALAKHFLTVSQSEKDARAAFEEFNKKIGGTDLQSFIDRVVAAGAVLDKNGEEVRLMLVKLEEATHKSPQAVADALKPLTELIDAADQKTAALKTGFDKLTTAAQAFGRQLPANLQASIRALLEMKGITDDERKALQQVLDAGQVNFKTLTDKAAGFGITLDALGPKFQQVNVESRSKELTDFLTDATAAGGDVGGMLAGLSDEISSLVNDSKKFGTAIPDNMKPYIEELIRAGKLTDENGKKIDDLTGISFEATPIDQAFQGLTDTIRDLINLLSGQDGVAGAIDKIGRAAGGIPKNPFAEWKAPDLPRTAGPELGPPQDDGGHFRVTTPTLFPVALHGPEDVMFSGENRAFGGGSGTMSDRQIDRLVAAIGQTSTTGPSVVVINGSGKTTDQITAEVMRQMVGRLHTNEDGIQSDIKRALGMKVTQWTA